jgi:hypothetical protein
MSLNPLKIATDGYLKRGTKAVLVIAVSGYLSFGGGGVPDLGNNLDSGDGFTKSEIAQSNNEALRRKRIQADDEEVFLIIQTFIKIQ